LLDKSSNATDDLKKEFRLFDKNNDGFIDTSELKIILQKILPKFKLPDDEIKRMISNIDKNNDGKIDYNGK
jgi:calmodulin